LEKAPRKRSQRFKKNIYIYFFNNCIVLHSEIDLVSINYLTLPQATGKSNQGQFNSNRELRTSENPRDECY